MKITTIISLTALTGGLFLAEEPLLAQVSPPGVPATAVSPPPPAVAPPKKIASFTIKQGGLMSDAVTQLLETMKTAQLPEMNVLYGPGAEQLPVPELNLRNVTGPDALRLIVASANCEATPINGERNEIIGYLIRAKADTARADPPASNFYGGSQFRTPSPANRGDWTLAPGNVPPLSAKQRKGDLDIPSQTLGFSLKNPPGKTGVYSSDAVLPKDSTEVRVYPLGVVSSNIKFTEIEGTLREVLKADGISADATKFALHEKTNVLVVTGTNRVQELVMQVLDALRKNQTDAEGRQTAMYEVTELKIRLDAERRQKEKLDEQLAKTEDQLRELNHEIARLKGGLGKPSP